MSSARFTFSSISDFRNLRTFRGNASFRHGHMRKQRIILKDHADISSMRGDLVMGFPFR